LRGQVLVALRFSLRARAPTHVTVTYLSPHSHYLSILFLLSVSLRTISPLRILNNFSRIEQSLSISSLVGCAHLQRSDGALRACFGAGNGCGESILLGLRTDAMCLPIRSVNIILALFRSAHRYLSQQISSRLVSSYILLLWICAPTALEEHRWSSLCSWWASPRCIFCGLRTVRSRMPS